MEINHKWGFGCAPIKTEVLEKRRQTTKRIVQFLDSPYTACEQRLVDISETKSLFNRVVRQDQWDWFTVWSMLGRPGRKHSQNVAENLKHLRDALKSSDFEGRDYRINALCALGVIRNLNAFLDGEMCDFQGGQVYILSTRENPDLLKIGYTTRSIEKRCNEINMGTGIVIPYGVRAVWVVSNAKETEQRVHSLLSPYRVRSDREFFRMPFEKAFREINNFVLLSNLEY